MRNPFEYGGVVTADAFCNREKELADILRAIENCEKLFIYSERRFGKTSLVLLALQRLSERRYVRAYVDLLPTDTEISFVTATAKAIAESMSTKVGKLLETASTLFGRLRPALTTDEEGKPTITFGIGPSDRPTLELDEVLRVPARVASQGKRKVVVVFDEIQQIMEYDTDIVERRLRSVVQRHTDVSYIFLGSRKHLIQKMFLDKSRPLYRTAGHYPLGPIGEEHWLPFIQRKFLDAGKHISDSAVRDLCRMTEGHPFYTQHLCHQLWDLCEGKAAVSNELIDLAVRTLLQRESSAYVILWDSLTVNQRRLLKGLACEPTDVQPFAAEFLRRYGLRSPSTAQRAVKTLLQRDIIDRENGSLVITDRFFRIWIRKIEQITA